ncbi:hypothetical protein GCM10007301_20490 [Azorhizobium oxalatiphilum]|uniref:DUF2023 domain-containing protein n=1 Tax=Azorhizobium oxalatiphilum TaxID=980631 RepID=A0A917BY34_9HYPH|nr:DUF2023 family protein [Azorhizobium oxalatiphilum]GGF60648.1 hypothetical protein GCM10007301_20490 [Azorhizobium oxalatiphilum]
MAGQAGLDETVTLRIFNHNIYEYRRGVRCLFLMTMGAQELPNILTRLEETEIDHFVQEVNSVKVNLFFGRAAFVDTTRSIVTKPLCQLTPEEDFMLGTLLGYDREQQCVRYLTRCARAPLCGTCH